MLAEWPEHPPKIEKENAIDKEQRNIAEALQSIKSADIFDGDYLENIKLVSYHNSKKASVFEKGIMRIANEGEFSMQDFMQGRRTDFVGINPKNEFDNINLEKLKDKQFLPFLFFNGKLTYEKFVAHEIAHNQFDLQYKSTHSDYEEQTGRTDVSEKYRGYIIDEIKDLVGSKYPNLELNRFSFSRQQIAEIFAYMYQREYCIRTNENATEHGEIEKRMEEFLVEPEKTLADFNEKHGRNCSLDDFYEENHSLSLLIVPMLEEKYPDFKKRQEFFNL